MHSQYSTSSRVFKMGNVFIGASCLVFVTFLAMSAYGPKSETVSAVAATSLFGSMARLPTQRGLRAAVVRPGAPMPSRWADGRRSTKVSAILSDTLASKYAGGLVAAAEEKGSLEAVHEQVEELKAAIAEVPELQKELTNLINSKDARKGIVDEIIQEKLTRNFFKLLIDNQREDILPEFFKNFEKLYNERASIVEATVTTAKEMSEEEQFEVAKKVRELANCKSVKIKPVIDKSIIGGTVIQFGSKVLDDSIRAEIDNLFTELDNAKLDIE